MSNSSQIYRNQKKSSSWGIKGNGVSDDSAAVLRLNDYAQNTTVEVEGPTLFSSPNISNIERFEFAFDAKVIDETGRTIVQSDAGKVVGLQHNYLQSGDVSSPNTIGNIAPAPNFTGIKQKGINCMALWYQDFGLEHTRAANGGNGWVGWYTWQWMFDGATGDGYEEKRHPWLGFYRGDDPRVLDWQCYWLNEAGVSGVVPQVMGDFSTIRAMWINPEDKNHWLYQLMNNTPNFKHLNYTLWAYSGGNASGDAAKTEASFDELVAIYSQYDNYNTIVKNGKTYAVVYAFESGYWRGVYDAYSGDTMTIDFLKRMSAKFASAGLGGLCVMARNPSSSLVGSKELESAGVLYLAADYGSTNYDPAKNGGKETGLTYPDLAVGVSAEHVGAAYPAEYTIPNIATDKHSHSAHPSGWDFQGSTPEWFGVMARNCIRRMLNSDSPPMVTVYNVTEHHEGGASLTPNMRDGKGYLDELRSALSSQPVTLRTDIRARNQAAKFLSGPSAFVEIESHGITSAPVTLSYSWTSSATPFIKDDTKYAGKRVRIVNGSGSGYALTLKGESQLAGSGLLVDAGLITIVKGSSVEFEWSESPDVWVQVSSIISPS